MMSGLKTIGCGKFSAANCKYEWKIRNFLSYNAKDSCYRSPKFNVSNSVWYMEIRKNGFSEDDKDSSGYVSLYLYKDLNQDEETGLMNFGFGIKSVNNTTVKEVEAILKNSSRAWGLPEFIKKSELTDRKSELLPSGTLTVICVIEVKDTTTNLMAEHEDLIDDLKDLYISKENADVSLKVGNRSFSAHKAILTARSPVFSSMFNNEMLEKKTGVVNIYDCDASAFNIFLLFLYSGEVDFGKCNACHLYKISDKYEVLKLKSMCMDFMIKNISVDNFYEIFILADQFGESKLSIEVECFFSKNFKDIVSSKSWESFLKNDFRLANDLLKAMAPKVKIVE